MTKGELEATISVLERFGIFFGILVAIGVTGESVIGFRLWWRNRDLKALQDAEIAALSERAASANKRAVELEALIQPRYLTDVQQDEIANAVRPYGGSNVLLMIGSHWNDPESARLARQIRAALNRGEIGSGPDQPVDLIGKFPQIPVGLWGGGVVEGTDIHEGVEIWGRNREAIAEALQSIGKMEATTPPPSNYPFGFNKEGLVAILVGVKPLPKVKPNAAK